jgi:hypothetical protein
MESKRHRSTVDWSFVHRVGVYAERARLRRLTPWRLSRININAGMVVTAPSATSPCPTARRRAPNRFETSNAAPKASAARVATMNPNFGVLNIMSAILSSVSARQIAKPVRREG